MIYYNIMQEKAIRNQGKSIHLPEELHSAIAEEAAINRRTLKAEIILRLEQSLLKPMVIPTEVVGR